MLNCTLLNISRAYIQTLRAVSLDVSIHNNMKNLILGYYILVKPMSFPVLNNIDILMNLKLP